MKKLLKVKSCLVLFLVLHIATGYAQETIMTDISYPFLEKLITTAKQNYAQVKIKQEQVNIAKTSLSLAKLNWADGIAASYTYNPSNTINAINPNLFLGFQAGVAISLGTIIKTPGTVKNARGAYKIALLEQQSFVASIDDEVKKRYFTYLMHMASLRLRTKSAQDAEYLFTQAKHMFEKGTETLDNYTKASSLLTDNTQAKIDAEAAVLIAKSSLEEIIGKKLEEVK